MEVRPLSVTLAACGEHERVRDVSRARRGGFGPHERSLAGRVPGAGDGLTPRKMCFNIPIRRLQLSCRFSGLDPLLNNHAKNE
jgi:hypothetical protein